MPTQKDQSQSVISAEKSRDLVKTAQYTSHCQPQMMLTQLAYLMEKIKKKKKNVNTLTIPEHLLLVSHWFVLIRKLIQYVAFCVV